MLSNIIQIYNKLGSRNALMMSDFVYDLPFKVNFEVKGQNNENFLCL